MSSSGNGGGNDDTPLRPAARPVPVAPKAGGDGDGGGASAGSQCHIVERTKVNSPDPTVRATLRSGDVLSLEYDPGPPKRLLVRTSSGAILGSITSPSMPQLIQCIGAGFAYDVVVLSILGGLIEVQVQPR